MIQEISQTNQYDAQTVFNILDEADGARNGEIGHSIWLQFIEAVDLEQDNELIQKPGSLNDIEKILNIALNKVATFVETLIDTLKNSQADSNSFNNCEDKTYNNVYNTVSEMMEKKKGIKNDEKKKHEITEMVTDLCKKYEISDIAQVIAEMLAHETGGYVFNERTMNPRNKQHKGVMQVDLKTCKSIFSEGGKNYKEWHKKHFSQDDLRIAELKEKYKTASGLYNAMKTDVRLGLEVGIIAFKAKIHQAKGRVESGLRLYCGNQYNFNFTKNPNVPRHIVV